MEVKPQVDIILLNFNGYKDTIECIKSLERISYDNYKIVVVDNNSTDESENKIIEFIKTKKNIVFIQTGENLGFSGGNNIGIKYSLENGADYICLLNNDTIVEKDFLNSLVDEMEIDYSLGMTAGMIMYHSHPHLIWSAGGYIDNKRALGRHFGMKSDELMPEYRVKKEVTFLTGCLQLIRRDVFKTIGLYDDEYFLYMEDVDFCYRCQKAGYKLKYIPDSKIYHKVSASTGEGSPIMLYYMTRNRLLYNKKNQNNIFMRLFLYLFIIMKLFIEFIRNRNKFKYFIKSVKDYLLGNFGKAVLPAMDIKNK